MAIASFAATVSAAEPGYRKEVTVAHETRLDWVFALSHQSRPDPPEEWLRGYDSTQQRYELFVPPPPQGKADGHPAILLLAALRDPR